MKWSKGKKEKQNTQREAVSSKRGNRDFGHFVVNSKSNLKQAGYLQWQKCTQNAHSVSKDAADLDETTTDSDEK